MAVVAASINTTETSNRKVVTTTYDCFTRASQSSSTSVQDLSRVFTHNWSRDTLYHAKRAAKQRLLNLPHTSQRTTTSTWRTHRETFCNNGNKSIDVRMSNAAPITVTIPVLLPSDKVVGAKRAQNRCILNARDMKVNLAQAFLERKQLVDLTQSVINRMIRAIRLARRRQFGPALLALGRRHPNVALDTRDLAGFWLSIQYAWKPLLNDVYGSLQQLQDADGRTWFSSLGKSKDILDTSVETFSNQGRNRTAIRTRSKCYTRTMCEWSISDHAILAASKVGLLNPLTLAWELTPFSFVADWFLPLGSYLDSLTATSGLSFMGGTTAQKLKGDWNVWATVRRTNPLSGGIDANGHILKIFDEKTRVVHATQPVPTIIPKNPFSWLHCSEALALLRVLC